MKKLLKTLSAALAVALLLCTASVVPAKAAGDDIIVTSLPELQSAIAAASDGDMIYIAEDIEITEDAGIGSVLHTVSVAAVDGKYITISISEDFPADQSVYFSNLVFMGGENSGISIIQHGGVSYFQMVTFQHPNQSSEASACCIEQGYATIRACNFEGGHSANGSHICIGENAEAHISGCNFSAGVASECGGSVYSNGSARISNCSFSYSSAGNKGGTVYSSGNLEMDSCTFYGGDSTCGGQLFCLSEASRIGGCSFTYGYASECGGGIGSDSDISLAACTITNCSAGQYGGGLWSAGVASIQQCKIWGNSANIAAADLYAVKGLTTLDTAEDYLTMYESELTDAGMNSAYWYLDSEVLRYSADLPTETFATPSEANGQPISLAFALSYIEEAQPPEENPDDVQPDVPSEPIVHPSHSSHHSGTASPTFKQSPKTLLSCESATINISAASEMCELLPRYIPSSKLITRAEMAGYLYGFLNHTDSKDVTSGLEQFYSDTENSPYRSIINSLTADGIFSGCGNSRFNPDSNLTYAQMIMVFARFTEPKDATIKHIDIIGHWAESGVKTAVALGWMDDAPIDLQAPVTLETFVSFVSKIIEASK